MPPPGPRPLRTGARVSTKTQIAADCKSERELKQKVAEEKKHVAAARKVERESKRQEKLISSAEVKASKATAKAKELHLKLAKGINTIGGETPFCCPQACTPEGYRASFSQEEQGVSSQSVAGAAAPSTCTSLLRGRARQQTSG